MSEHGKVGWPRVPWEPECASGSQVSHLPPAMTVEEPHGPSTSIHTEHTDRLCRSQELGTAFLSPFTSFKVNKP